MFFLFYSVCNVHYEMFKYQCVNFYTNNFKIESSDIKSDLIAKNKRDISEAYKILEQMLAINDEIYELYTLKNALIIEDIERK